MTTDRAAPWRPSRFAVVLALIAFVGLGLRIVYIEFGTRHDLWGDAAFYDMGANALADGAGYSNPIPWYFELREEHTLPDGRVVVLERGPGAREPSALHPPGLITFLGIESWLGLRTVREHQITLALVGTASIVLIGMLGRALRSPRVGLIAAAIAAVYANVWINDGLVMTETVSIFCVLVMTLLALRFWRRPTPGAAAWFAIACGVGMLTRVELALYLPIVALAWIVRTKSSWGRRLATVALMAAVAGAVIAPWVVRNLVVFRDTVTLSDGSGITLDQANCDLTYDGPWLGTWNAGCSKSIRFDADGNRLDESQESTALAAHAREYIDGHTGRLLTVVVPARIGRLWGVFRPFQTVRFEIDEWRPAFPSWLGFWQYVLLAPTAVIGAVIHWRRRAPWLVLGAWPIIVTVTAATAFGNIRYRSTAEPALVIFAAIAIGAALDWWHRRRAHVEGVGAPVSAY